MSKECGTFKDDSGNTVKNELEPETIRHITIEGDFGVIAVTLEFK